MNQYKKVKKPKSLQIIKGIFYKKEGVNAYYLLDELKDGYCPVLFYSNGKWREDKAKI